MGESKRRKQNDPNYGKYYRSCRNLKQWRETYGVLEKKIIEYLKQLQQNQEPETVIRFQNISKTILKNEITLFSKNNSASKLAHLILTTLLEFADREKDIQTIENSQILSLLIPIAEKNKYTQHQCQYVQNTINSRDHEAIALGAESFGEIARMPEFVSQKL